MDDSKKATQSVYQAAIHVLEVIDPTGLHPREKAVLNALQEALSTPADDQTKVCCFDCGCIQDECRAEQAIQDEQERAPSRQGTKPTEIRAAGRVSQMNETQTIDVPSPVANDAVNPLLTAKSDYERGFADGHECCGALLDKFRKEAEDWKRKARSRSELLKLGEKARPDYAKGYIDALDAAVLRIWSERWEPPYTIENRVIKQIEEMREEFRETTQHVEKEEDPYPECIHCGFHSSTEPCSSHMLCVCGHFRKDHIYEQGACRRGKVCESGCKDFRAETTRSKEKEEK